MSEYGIKIKNYEAASIYGFNLGIRTKMDYTDAMLTNSLFLDFLNNNGLKVWKEESTRDVVCLAFSYGSPSYEKEIEDKKAKIKKLEDEETINYYNEKIRFANENKDKFKEISKNDLRTLYYVNGLEIKYPNETIHYKMLYRTPGKAKKGTCMFIRDELYDAAHEFLYMGIQLPKHNSPIVEIGAYASLITSSIVGKVQIKPEQILVVKDVETFMTTNVVKILTNAQKECYAERENNYRLVSTLFDGQALIDYSIFPEWAEGYVLLRHHMTKCAAFNTNIELFMREHFGDEYETAIIKDMWGRDVRVKDIKLITTDNAMKWLKFNVSFDYWADWVRANDCQFGIVKTVHESKFGDVQRTSYQMVNALSIDSMDSIVGYSKCYIEKLKSDDNEFLEYLKKNINFSNDYEVLLALVEHNPEFIRSEYFRDRKRKIIEAYVLDFKSGRTLQNADNLTIVGSPYAMLMHAVGDDCLNDPTFKLESGTIQCWTSRFNDGEYLAEFRNPFNSRNNLGYVHNVYHPYFDKYFNFGKLIIAVNLIETDFQSRNNGSDQDSDSCYTTNQSDIVAHAKYCYENYPTIVNEIKPEKNIYDYSLESYAAIDNSLTAAQMAIGQSSNMAQLALTYTYNFEDEKYYNYVCILSVLAQCAIDNAKRKYAVNLEKEIPRIKKDMDTENNGLPKFWQITKKDKRKAKNDAERVSRQRDNRNKIKAKINKDLKCPMNYLYDMEFNKYRLVSSTLPMSEFFINHIQDNDRRKSKKVEELIEKYSIELYKVQVDFGQSNINWKEDDADLLLMFDFEKLIEDIKQIYISKNYLGLMSWLINRAFYIGAGVKSKKDINMDSTISKNKPILLKVLYTINPDAFLQCFKKCTTI